MIIYWTYQESQMSKNPATWEEFLVGMIKLLAGKNKALLKNMIKMHNLGISQIVVKKGIS